MKKVFSVIASIQGKLAAILMVLLVGTVTTQMVGRSVLHIPVLWTEELARYLLIWITFIGGVSVIIRGESLCVDFLKIRFNERQMKTLRLLTALVMLAFSAFLCYFGVRLCTYPTIVRSRTPVMLLPRWLVFVVLPTTMGLVALYSLCEVFEAVRSFFVSDTGGDSDSGSNAL